MAVKARNKKKLKMKKLVENAVKIKCCYCDIYNTCTAKVNKEKSEKLGITTYCTLTPNTTKAFIKSKKDRGRKAQFVNKSKKIFKDTNRKQEKNI